MSMVRGIALVTAILVVGAGLCLLDSDHPGSAIDLCGSLLTLAVGLTVAVPLVIGRFSTLSIALLLPYFPDLPYPPPRR